MNKLDIETENLQTDFLPGQIIRGRARWHVMKDPKRAALRLLWYTVGKGTEDVGVADEREFQNPDALGDEAFEFAAPPAPWSFSGKLISLVWALELTVGGESVRQEIILSPTGREILLHGDTTVDARPA